jgi:hypothetical protein
VGGEPDGLRPCAKGDSWFLAMAPPSVGEILSWMELSFHVVVEVEVSEAPVLRHMGERWSMPPSPLDTVRYSFAESSIVGRCGVDAPL